MTVIAENTKGKLQAIINIEGVCPYCRSKKTKYKVITDKIKGQNLHKNRYRCTECGTVWESDLYNDNIEFV